MLTPFGKELRKLRVDRQLRLFDLAQLLQQSTSYISAIETGRKVIPDGYVGAIKDALDLDDERASALQRAADQTKPEIRTDSLSGQNRELLAAFARNIDGLDEEFLREVRRRVMKSMDGDVPFKRKKGLLVGATSTRQLRADAERVRAAFVPNERIQFPIVEVLEFGMKSFFPLFELVVCDRAEMGSDEGRVIAGVDAIMLRQDVYDGACQGVGRHRFTACHELGHYFMHRSITLPRVRQDQDPVYRDAEWQADVFAGSLLISPRHLSLLAGPDDAAKKCGVTPAAARVMWTKYLQEGRM